jgi:hypothetical protein
MGLVDLPPPDGDQLGEDGDGDFLRRDRANVESNRRVHPLQEIRRHLLGEQRVVQTLDLGLTANQPEVAEIRAASTRNASRS